MIVIVIDNGLVRNTTSSVHSKAQCGHGIAVVGQFTRNIVLALRLTCFVEELGTDINYLSVSQGDIRTCRASLMTPSIASEPPLRNPHRLNAPLPESTSNFASISAGTFDSCILYRS